MKRGAKRPALDSSGPALDSSGPELWSRRVTETPANHPGIDPHRAESSRNHVTALNKQFASWVEFQLQNHPDELWEDGVKDYLSHASHIMENFKDVVDWLRANAAESSGMPTIVSRANAVESSGISTTISPIEIIEQNNLVVVSDKNKSDTNSGSAQASTSASSPSLLTSGSLFSSQSSSSLFSQSTSSLFSSSQSLGSAFGSQSSASSLFSSQSSGSSLFSSQSSTSSLFSFQSSASSLFGSQSSGSLFGFQSSGSLFGSQSQGSLFSLQSSSLFSSSQTPSFPVSSGTQSPSLEVEASDEEDEPKEPSSPSLEKAEEKGIVVVHEVKCKVYLKPDDPADKGWKDMGVGQLSVKCKEGASKATKESTPTIVIRNDVGKILLNALIYPGIKLNIQNKTIASIFHTLTGNGADSSKSVARMYLLRMKNLEDTTKLAKTIEEHVPSG